jgi:hypothetical protein
MALRVKPKSNADLPARLSEVTEKLGIQYKREGHEFHSCRYGVEK